MAKAKLQNLNSQIIKNLPYLRVAKKNLREGVGAGRVQGNDALIYEIDRIVWAISLLDDLRVDQGMMNPHYDQVTIYRRLSLIYFWIDGCVSVMKQITSDSQ